MTKFNKCPNCGHTGGGFLIPSLTIYEYKECGTCYCFRNDCGSKNRRKAGTT